MKRHGCRLIRIPPTARLLLALLLALSFLPPHSVRAGAYTYNSGVSARTVNAGILLINTSALTTPGSEVFFKLSQRADYIPSGWNIVNPRAPKTVTADIAARYSGVSVGKPMTSDKAPYWEVRLAQATNDDLQQYDVLLIDLNAALTLTPAQTEKLRRFVDGGGTLWIEGIQGSPLLSSPKVPLSPNPIPAGAFVDVPFGTGMAAGTSSPVFNPTVHALLTTPFRMTSAEENLLASGDGIGAISSSPQKFMTTVLKDSGGASVIEAGQYGAGAIIVTSTHTAQVIDSGSPALSVGPNLKLLTNLIAWAGEHSGERQSGHQNGSAFNSFPSPVRVWNAPVTTGNATSAPSSPVISGSLAFVTDRTGVLHAYDINPGEDLDNDGNKDDGVSATYRQDYSYGKSYDEVWSAATNATNVSAPTVITDASGNKLVLVETDSGQVKAYNAATGASVGSISVPPGAGGGNFAPALTPAPVSYNNMIYATQPDTSISFYDLANSTPGTYKIFGTLDTPTGPPAIGIIPVDLPVNGLAPLANDIVALQPTTKSLFSIFLGARGEQLRSTGATGQYATKLLVTGTIYSPSVNIPLAYGLDVNGVISTTTTTPPNVNTFMFAADPGIAYADYDTDLSNTNSDLTRTQVGITSNADTTGGTGGTVSTPSLDRFGNAYYITSLAGKSSLVSFHDSATPASIRLNWRFRLPTAADGTVVDADNVDYTNLVNYQFIGVPVVDERGYVYALATNGTQVAVLCFNGLQSVTTEVLNGDTSDFTFAQPLSTTGADEFGNTPETIIGSQYTGGNGPVTLTNFGKSGGSTGVTRLLSPDMSEPQALTITSNSTTGATNTFVLKLHTNLNWYTILPAGVSSLAPAGLTKAGNALFFVDGDGRLISVVADPVAAGIPIINKYVDSATTSGSLPALATVIGNTNLVDMSTATSGVSPAVPSVANGVLIVNGQLGVAGYANQVTVVADGSRVMELNSSGDATWEADATTGVPPQTATAAALAAAASAMFPQPTAPSLDLSHPSSVAQISGNDYLVADTGNNRCVRFSRSGQVIWELSRFNDGYDSSVDVVATAPPSASFTPAFHKTKPLLAPGEPDTLNQPTSVQIYTRSVTINSTAYTVVQYLISDTGNYRILEVIDVFNAATGVLVGTPHNLVWISHTHDKLRRNYRYQSAAYYPSASFPASIVALVTNKRIPNMAAGGTLTPASQDSAGGSIVFLNLEHDQTSTTDGMVNQVQSQFQAYLTGSAATGYRFDVDTAVKQPANATPMSLFIRNPRFLQAYVPQNAGNGGPAQAFLLADDDGVFDIARYNNNYIAQWGFTQADYQSLTTQYIPGSTASTPRNSIPFVPYSIQRTATDEVGSYGIGRYLVTNGYSQGEASSAAGSGFGGEALELYVANTNPLQTLADGAHTLSRPSNTSPLVNPAFAYRMPSEGQ